MILRSGLALLIIGLAQPGQAADPPQPSTEKVSFAREIRPLFMQHCVGCHQPARSQGSYLMTSRADLLRAGDSNRPAIVPGKPEQSNLIMLITPHNGKPPTMPKNKPPLSEKQVALIKRWIAEGAIDDTPLTSKVVIDADNPPVYTSPPVIPALDYSPDGKLLAVAGYHEVLLWSADGSKIEARLVGLSERVQSLAFSPDGKRLAVSGGSPARFGEIQVWDVAKKKLLLSHTVTGDTLFGVSWSPDGSKIAFGCTDSTVRAIEADTGKQVVYMGTHTDWVLDTVFSRDGEYLASVSRDRSVRLTEVATQRFIDNVTSITPGKLTGGLQALARRPLKEVTKTKATGEVIGDTRERIYEEILAAGSDGTPRLYKMHRTAKRVIGDDANKLKEFAAMPGRVFAVAFAPDAQRFAAGSSDGEKGEVRVYNINDGKFIKCDGQKGAVYALSISPDGKTVASAGFDGLIRLNEAQTGKLIKEFVAVPLKKK